MKPMYWMLAAVAVASAACAPIRPAPSAAQISAAVASRDRPASDTRRDSLRKPSELIAFAGIKPGDRVADLLPGKGYFTRIFSKMVGPDGRVYAVVPAEFLQMAPKAADDAQAIGSERAFSNVVALTAPIATMSAPEPLDVVWTSDNYHDVYGALGAGAAAQLDTAVFKALKPGGVFIVIDHAANTDPGNANPKTLHRIDPEMVKAQALAAGFRLEAESTVLRNPADTRELPVFSPAIRGHTDQFVFKFRKPSN